MLDFLFQLGQLVSLLGFAAGLVLTVRYRYWIDEADTTRLRMPQIDRLATLSQSNELPGAFTESDAAPGHRDAFAA
jgi:hypothetical protein